MIEYNLDGRIIQLDVEYDHDTKKVKFNFNYGFAMAYCRSSIDNNNRCGQEAMHIDLILNKKDEEQYYHEFCGQCRTLWSGHKHFNFDRSKIIFPPEIINKQILKLDLYKIEEI